MSMSQVVSQSAPKASELPPLEPGDHLDQPTFHARYLAMPEDVQAELVGGIVYMPSPLRARHGRVHMELNHWLMEYKADTPGVDALDNATVILGDDSEPQPDACLRILPEYGGQSRENEEGYVVGPPELIAEVALSSESYDLHTKLRDYERSGVQEYLALSLRQSRADWFVLEDQKYVALTPDDRGILRSRLFGGLWLDSQALLDGTTQSVQDVLQKGLASNEHAEMLRRLQKR
jgi:Uma2 family endonuclease